MLIHPQANRLLKVLAVGLALISTAVSANVCPPVEPGIQTAYQDFTRLQSAVRGARDALDMAQFHPASLQAKLGREPETLLAWVRDNTRWLDYEGSLRGPSGVLIDRMGSSLDRSLLLAALLETAGHPVQLASAPLNQGDLERLRSGWTGERATIEPITNVPVEKIRVRAEAFALEPDELVEALQQRTRLWHELRELLAEQTRRQAQVLERGLREDLPSEETTTRSHWWVKVHHRGSWHDLDPALPDLAAGQSLTGPASSSRIIDDIEDDQFHRLTVRILAEQWADGSLREHMALEQTLRTSQLIQHPLRIDLVPTSLPTLSNLLDGVPTDLPDQVAKATEWLPVLRVGNEPISDQLILADGSVRPPDRGPTQGRTLQEASSLLGQLSVRGLGAEQTTSRPELSAVRLVFQIDAPGREAVVIQRELMDMVGPGQRRQGQVQLSWDDALRTQRAVAMLGNLQIQGQVAWLNEEFVAWQRYGALINDRLGALAVLDAQAHGRMELMEAALDSRSELNDALLALAQMRYLFSPEQTRIALTHLNLLAWFEQVELNGQQPVAREGFDVLHNPVAIVSDTGEGAARSRMKQGVLDTLLEAWILDARGERLAGNAARHFLQDLDEGINWVWLHQPDDLELFQQRLPPDILEHLGDVLASGRVVVLPDRTLAQNEPTWWEIDPMSGTTLGYGPDRRGQASEGVIMFMKALNNARSAVGMVMSIWDCLFKHGSAPGMQCCIHNTAMKEAMGRFIGGGFSDIADVAGLTFASGGVLIDTLDQLAVSHLVGRFANSVTDSVLPLQDCPD